jgi:hypothetical protein
MVMMKRNVTHSELESLNKTDGLFDRTANVEVVDGDLATGSMSVRMTLGDAERRVPSSLCRVAKTTWGRDR